MCICTHSTKPLPVGMHRLTILQVSKIGSFHNFKLSNYVCIYIYTYYIQVSDYVYSNGRVTLSENPATVNPSSK